MAPDTLGKHPDPQPHDPHQPTASERWNAHLRAVAQELERQKQECRRTLEWLSSERPTYACGTPLSREDVKTFTRLHADEWDRLVNFDMLQSAYFSDETPRSIRL